MNASTTENTAAFMDKPIKYQIEFFKVSTLSWLHASVHASIEKHILRTMVLQLLEQLFLARTQLDVRRAEFHTNSNEHCALDVVLDLILPPRTRILGYEPNYLGWVKTEIKKLEQQLKEQEHLDNMSVAFRHLIDAAKDVQNLEGSNLDEPSRKKRKADLDRLMWYAQNVSDLDKKLKKRKLDGN